MNLILTKLINIIISYNKKLKFVKNSIKKAMIFIRKSYRHLLVEISQMDGEQTPVVDTENL